MSSNSIASEISQCQNQITYLEAKICELRTKFEKQKNDFSNFKNKRIVFEERVLFYEKRQANIEQMSGTVEYARKINMHFLAHKEKRHSQIIRLENIEGTMRTEICETDRVLQETESELVFQRQRLAALDTAYVNACREEAAASAAQAKSSKEKRNGRH